MLLLLLLSHFSRVRLCPALWTAAYQAPPPMGFSRQQYWGGLPLPSLKQCYICYKNMTKIKRVMCKWLESEKQYIKMSGYFFSPVKYIKHDWLIYWLRNQPWHRILIRHTGDCPLILIFSRFSYSFNFWLRWAFIAVCRLCLVANGGNSLVAEHGL